MEFYIIFCLTVVLFGDIFVPDMKKFLSLFLIVALVSPAFADRRLQSPKSDFSSFKAYDTQATRAKSDPKQAYILACACADGKAASNRSEENWMKVAAKGGIPDAQYKLGLWAYNRNDFFEAVMWYKRAADQGLIEAKCKLAHFYLTGVSRKVPKAGTDDSARFLGRSSRDPFGAAVSSTQELGGGGGYEYVAKFLSKCMTASEYEAMDKSKGYTYEDVVPKDPAKAMEIYKGYAKLNLPEVNYMVGRCFELGLGVPKNKKKALEMYERAAKQKFPEAQEVIDRLKQESEIEDMKSDLAQ